MRHFLLLSALCALSACATTKPLTPREYLDERTSATITVAADPVIFVAESAGSQRRVSDGDLHPTIQDNRDYLELYGVDVNRMGIHRQYIAVMKWMAPIDDEATPTLSLHSGTDVIELKATADDARQLGLAKPPAASFSDSSRWWYFPTNAATMKKIAAASELRATLIFADSELAYVVFSDGRAQLAELTAVLPQ